MTAFSGESDTVLLDLNNAVFQRQLFALEKAQQLGVLATLRKLAGLRWPQVYQNRGLKWELIHSRSGPDGHRLYSLRIVFPIDIHTYIIMQWTLEERHIEYLGVERRIEPLPFAPVKTLEKNGFFDLSLVYFLWVVCPVDDA